MIAGVCAGLGQWSGIDPTVVRLLFIAFTLAGGSGVVLYLVGWIVIPEAEGATIAQTSPARAGGAIIGGVLVIAGAWLLAERLVPGFADVIGRAFWPLLLILVGVALLLRRS